MNTRFILLLIATTLLAPAAVVAADEAQSDSKPKLAVVVVESLRAHGGAITEVERIEMALEKVAKERNWPVEVEVERFAANTPDNSTELRIFPQRIRQELPGEFVFRGWVVLKVDGKEHDFGIVKFEYRPRPGEWMDDSLDKIYRGAMEKTADKVEPLLFPKEEVSAPARKP